MADLLLHPTTEQKLEQYLAVPSHALLITGPSGVGKGAILDLLSTRLLGRPAQDNPHILRIAPAPDKQEIGVDAVRQIQHFVALKPAQSTTKEPIKRIVLVEDAHRLTKDAQNALLKIIEEPPADTILLLSSVTARQLLPTVVSRVQELAITVPSTESLRVFLGSKGSGAELDRAISMSGGLPGFALALLDQAGEHPMNQASEWARRLLSATKFERLLAIDALSKQRDQAVATCDMLGRMASLMLKNPKLDISQQQKWQNIMKHATTAGDQLRAYGQPKLVLTSLSLHL